ncbi:unnamed protein product, partial [Didymodactylos carnosus]
MINTGATHSIITEKTLRRTKYRKFITNRNLQLFMGDGYSPLEAIGVVDLDIKINSTLTTISAFVVKHLSADCLLGMDYINKYKLKLDMAEHTISIRTNQTTTTISINQQPEELRLPVRLINSVIIPPLQEVSVLVSAGISSASVLFKPSFNLKRQVPLLMCNSILAVERHTTSVPLYNPSHYAQYLSKGIILGTIRFPPDHNISLQVDNIPVSDNCELNILRLLAHIQDETQHSKVKSVLLQRRKPFDNSKSTIATTTLYHTIPTTGHHPFASKPFPLYGEKRQELKKLLDELQLYGHIRRSDSHYAAPAILVEKKDKKYRLVVDYRQLNSVTIKDPFPLPRMEDTLQELGQGYRYFSKLDLKSGFFQFTIDEKDRHKTAFTTSFGVFEFTVLPQGLKNSPPSFQRIMSRILEPCRPYCI